MNWIAEALAELSQTDQETVHDAMPFLLGIISTLIIRWAAYKWPTGYHRRNQNMERNDSDATDT
jgi:hypothetical protein